MIAISHAPFETILAHGFGPPGPRGSGQPFRFYETWSSSCPIPSHLRNSHDVIVWVDLPAGRAQGYEFQADRCGNVFSHGVNGWISHSIIARAIPCGAL